MTFVITEDDEKQPIITNDSKKKGYPSNLPKISLQDLQKATSYDLLKIEPGTEISTFTFTIDNADGFFEEFVNEGSILKPQTKQLINNAKAGRVFTIDNISIVKDGTKKRIPSKVYQVVD